MYCGRQFQHYIQPFTNALLSNGDIGFVQSFSELEFLDDSVADVNTFADAHGNFDRGLSRAEQRRAEHVLPSVTRAAIRFARRRDADRSEHRRRHAARGDRREHAGEHQARRLEPAVNRLLEIAGAGL